MGHCRDCRFWRKDGQHDSGVCEQIVDAAQYNGRGILRAWLLVDDCSADLITTPDFGCVAFASKDEDLHIGDHVRITTMTNSHVGQTGWITAIETETPYPYHIVFDEPQSSLLGPRTAVGTRVVLEGLARVNE